MRYALAAAVLAASVAWGGHAARAQLAPEQELTKLRHPDDIAVSLFASEPMITNPAAIDVDTKGRVWVAEIQWYRGAAKVPPADKIKVLEDTDGDGKADKSTVFADGLFAPMSVCVAGDRVYVATSPDLWVFEDKDGDLRADGPPRRLLTGFGGYNHDHGAHSLVLGPDHKWWMSHGDTGFDVKGTDGSSIKYAWGGMLRGELDGSRLETVAVNFRNPYEICVSSFGEPFCSDNDNDGNVSCRICWIMEGGNYGWFGGPPGPRGSVPPGTPFGEHWHFRGHIPGNVPATLVTGFGSPTGICFYEGDAFGPKYKDAPLHTDAGPREVRLYRHEGRGYGMKAQSEVFLTSSGDDYFRPDDICAAPDGSLFVSDWYDGGVGGHGYNNPNQGRIFLLRPRGKTLRRVGKPGPYDTADDAAEGLRSPNLATQYLARERLLADPTVSVPILGRLLQDPEPDVRARAVWVLDRTGGEARARVVGQLESPDSRFRALAVRVLRRHGRDYEKEILTRADDPSDEVKREVLLAIAGLQSAESFEALARIAASYDGSDRYQLEAINIAAGTRRHELYERIARSGRLALEKLALILVLEPKAAAEFLVSQLEKSQVDAERGRVLMDAAGGIPSADAGRALLAFASRASAPVELRRLALEKVAANLGGNWKELAGDDRALGSFRKLLGDEQLRGPALALVGEHQLKTLGPDVARLAADPSRSASARAEAIRVVARLNLPESQPTLRSLLGDKEPEIRAAALDALVDVQDLKTLRRVLSGEASVPAEEQARAAGRLMGSSGGALLVLRLADEGRLSEASKSIALAKAAGHADSNVRVLFEKYLPAEHRPKRLGDAIQPEQILALKGDPSHGEQIFHHGAVQCRSCHLVHGEGGQIGPDLSLIGKKYERAALLETILRPSKAIAPEYVPYLLETSSGQVFAGFLVERGPKEVVLKDAQGKLVRTPADQVEALQAQKTSLMPELVLKDVSAQDAADLLAYLKTLTQEVQVAGRLRVLGPFDAEGGDAALDARTAAEDSLESPSPGAEYRGIGGKPIRWEVVATDNAAGFSGFDSVRYCQSRGMRSDKAACYFLVYADSSAEQDGSLLLGSDDGCKVWVNGRLVHRNATTRALGFGQDRVPVRLKQGRNAIVVKVVNNQGPGGVSLAVAAPSGLVLKTE